MRAITPAAGISFTSRPIAAHLGGLGAIAALGSLAVAQPCVPQWTALGSGVDSSVLSLGVYNDGGGAALYAGGLFLDAGGVPANRVAKWDGQAWSPLGTGTVSSVSAFAVFGAGPGGPDLYVGGAFSSAGGVAGTSRIARWDGTSWSAVGTGMSSTVKSFAVFDDGTGPALHACGFFTTAGGVPASRVAKWDGTAWSALGSGVNTTANVMAVADVGGGPALYIGGLFLTAGGVTVNRIAKWDGAAWSALSTGVDNTVRGLVAFDDGGGTELYIGGDFTTAGGVTVNGIAKWDGTAWSAVGTGAGASGDVKVLKVFDDGGGPALYAGGVFQTMDGVTANGIAKWDGTSWTALDAGVGTNLSIDALTVFDDGGGAALYAGGQFTTAGSVAANRIARWGCPAAVACYPDCDGDDALTLADFGCFQTKFALGDLYADCNGDAVLNLADFGCFQTEYALGCP